MSEHDEPELRTDSDQVVRFEEAYKWSEELFPQRPASLRDQLLPTEPALVAIAAHLSDRLAQRLKRHGVDRHMTGEAADAAYQIGLICSIVACRGYRQFLHDLYNRMEE